MRSKVLRYIRDRGLMCAGDRVCVAVSGGADSVALLRLLLELRAELGIVLAVAHFNHGLRGADSDADEAFVAHLAGEHELQFFAAHGAVRDHAFTSKLSVEAAGRELRYRWLTRLATEQRFDCVATAHTLDDQAETVLLKFLRGAGTRGLAGIYPSREIGKSNSFRSGVDDVNCQDPSREAAAGIEPGAQGGAPDPRRFCADWGTEAPGGLMSQSEPRSGDLVRIVRPLLGVTRVEVESYLASLGQDWREDESNLDHRFARNRVRHELLPLLERDYNPNLRQLLSDAAELARAEEEYWQALVERELEARAVSVAEAELQPRGKQVPRGLIPPQAQNRRLLGAPASPTRDDKNKRPDGTAEAVPFQIVTGTIFSASCEAVPLQEPAPARLSLENFAELPLAFQRRLLRRFAERNDLALDFEHVEKLLRCAHGELPKTELPGGWLAVRRGDCLELPAPAPESPCPGYEYALPIPGEVKIAEIGLTIRAVTVREAFAQESDDTVSLLGADLLGPELTVRNWRPGDRFHPAHSGSEEKLKRLFAEKHIPAEQRSTWPVALQGEQIVWVRGFPVARSHAWAGTGDAVKIEVE